MPPIEAVQAEVEPRPAVAPQFKSSIARNVVSNWAVTASSIVYSLVVTPLVIRALDRELYGLWSFLNGLLVYSDLLYLGIGIALSKQVARHSVTGNHVAINRLASVVLSILTVVGLLCFLVMTGLSAVVPSLLGSPMAVESARAATYTCVLLGVQLFCFFSSTTYIAILVGYDRFDLVNLGRLSTLAFRFVLVGVALQASSPLLGLAILMTIAVMLDFAVVRFLAHRVSHDLELFPVRPRSDELRLLYGFGLQSFLIQLSSKLISYTDVTVIAVSLGAASVGLYVLPLQLVEYLRIALGGISGVLMPRLTGMAMREDVQALRAAYLQSTRLVAIVAAFIISNMLWLAVPFLTIWVGPEFGGPARPIIACLAGATLLHVFSSLVALPFYQAMGIMAMPAKVLMVEAVVNLVLSVILVRVMGINGVALATLLPALLVSFVVLPRYLCSKLSLPVAALLLHSLLPALLVGLSVAGVQWMLAERVSTASYVALLLRALAAVPLATLVAMACLSTEERRWLYARLSDGWRLRLR